MTGPVWPALDITVMSDGPPLRLAVRGDIDLATVDGLVDNVGAHLDETVQALVLDLSGVGFCDSSGLNGLVKIRNRCTEQGTTMTIVGATRTFRNIADLTGLTDFLGVQDQ